MKRFFSLLFIFITLLFCSVTSVGAQQPSWQIDNFKSQISIENSGEVNIEEVISVDFGTQEKHGIYRYIPYLYQDSSGKTYTKIEKLKITLDGQSEKYETSDSNGNLLITIGKANKTISGKHEYKIRYQASGILKSFGSYDELYWNVTGNNWDVPILKSSATVTMYRGAIHNNACFQGLAGSDEKCIAKSLGPQSVSFETTRSLNSNEGLTIAAGFSKGSVPILIIDPPKPLILRLMDWPLIFLFIITVFAFWTGIVSLWWKHGRDFWFRKKDLFDPKAKEEVRPPGSHETIVVEYSPPGNLRPAQLGVIIDQKANTRDVTATIIDLATRGYFKIAEEPKSWKFGKTDYILTKIDKKQDDLLAYEKYLLDELFAEKDQIKISELKNTFYDELAKVKDKLYEEVVSNKFFIKRPDRVRLIYLAIAIAVIFCGIALIIAGIANSSPIILDLGLAVFVGALPLVVLSNFMPRRTAFGREMHRRARGYYLFIDKAEENRQRFFEDKNLFNEILPYAITFGIVNKFARAMKDIGLKPETVAWYTGNSPFNVGSFGNNIENFSKSLGTAIASTPRSSGSGGGGFSGGGFGGGGGGSW